MLILMMISVLIGVVLGLRFKVFILVPAIGLALAIAAAVNGIVVGEGAWQLVGTMVVVATSLQLGYVGGSIVQFVTATRASDHGKASVPTSTELSPSGQLPNRGGASSRFETRKQLRQA
jgi:hypothetical protein